MSNKLRKPNGYKSCLQKQEKPEISHSMEIHPKKLFCQNALKWMGTINCQHIHFYKSFLVTGYLIYSMFIRHIQDVRFHYFLPCTKITCLYLAQLSSLMYFLLILPGAYICSALCSISFMILFPNVQLQISSVSN